jgi:hypothetical protein
MIAIMMLSSITLHTNCGGADQGGAARTVSRGQEQKCHHMQVENQHSRHPDTGTITSCEHQLLAGLKGKSSARSCTLLAEGQWVPIPK